MCFKFYFFFLIFFLPTILSQYTTFNFGNYSNILYTVSSFDYNIYFCLFFVCFLLMLFYSRIFGTAYLFPCLLLIPSMCLIVANSVNTPKKIKTDCCARYNRYVLNYLTVFEGPSYLHGISFLVFFSFFLVLVFYTIYFNAFTGFFYNYFRFALFLVFFSFFVFISGAFWAFFSSVWGNWYNNDAVELYYLIIFFLVIFFSHNFQLNSKTFFFLFCCLSFLFFICLRFGLLNSKHSNSLFKVATGFYGTFFFNLVFFYFTACLWAFSKKSVFFVFKHSLILFLELFIYSFLFIFFILFFNVLQLSPVNNLFFFFFIVFIFYFFFWFCFLFYKFVTQGVVKLFIDFHILICFFLLGWFLYSWWSITQLNALSPTTLIKRYNFIALNDVTLNHAECGRIGGTHIILTNCHTFPGRPFSINVFNYFFSINHNFKSIKQSILVGLLPHTPLPINKFFFRNYLFLQDCLELYTDHLLSLKYSNMRNFFNRQLLFLDFIFVKVFLFLFVCLFLLMF